MKPEYLNISNALSLLRLLSAIPFWFLLDPEYRQENLIFIILLVVIALISDFLDGFFARKFNQITEFGKIIDPLADKICVGVITIRLFYSGELSQLFFYMIIFRDILIFVSGIYLSSKIGKVLPSNMLGKITVTFISIVLVWVTVQINQENIWFQSIYLVTLGLVIASFIAYAIRGYEILKGKHENI